MKKHIFWMIIGCTLPLLLIFFAPAFGLGENVSLFIFVIAMFACHLMIPMHKRAQKFGAHKKHSETS